jgi:hypothetical protein
MRADINERIAVVQAFRPAVSADLNEGPHYMSDLFTATEGLHYGFATSASAAVEGRRRGGNR